MQATYFELELHLILTLQTCLFHLCMLELHVQKMAGIHSALSVQVVTYKLRIVWEICFVIHMVLVYVRLE
jgi:hypothetical protein